MYVGLVLIPLSLSVACTLTAIEFVVALPCCDTVTFGTVSSFIVVLCTSPLLLPFTNLTFTVFPCVKFCIVPLFAILVQLPSVVPFIWYSIPYPDVVFTCMLAFPPLHVTVPNVIVPTGVSSSGGFSASVCTVIVFSMLPSLVSSFTFMSYFVFSSKFVNVYVLFAVVCSCV